MRFITPDELLYVSRTVWIEARGESRQGKRAVVHVIYNRSERRGTDMVYEAARPWQFSGWNPGDHHRAKARALTLDSPSFRTAICATLEALDEIQEGKDPTHGSDHYHADYVYPKWAKRKTPVVVIGKHLFYNDIN